MAIPTPDQFNPELSHSADQKPNGEGSNPGFDIFRFIRNELNNPSHFKDIFLSYTDTLSEKTKIYWFIYFLCFGAHYFYGLLLHALMFLVLLLVVFGFAKAVGFTDIIFPQPKDVTQVEYVIPQDLKDSIKAIKNQHTEENKKLNSIQNQINSLNESRQPTISATVTPPARIVPTR